MTTTIRNDVHRPSEIIPTNYEFVDSYQLFISFGTLDCQDGMEGFEDTDVLHQDGPWFNGEPHGDPLKCDVCGTNHRAGGVFFHQPSGEFIKMGRDCADKYHLIANWRKLDGQKKNSADMRAKVRLRLKAKAELRKFVAATPADVLAALRGDHYITKDIRGKVIRFARLGKDVRPLSEKQQALVLKLAAQMEKRDEEAKVAAPISDKRQQIEGVIVSVKLNEWDNLRMTIKVTTDAGVWLANGTCPSGLGSGLELGDSGLRGCTVRFMAKMDRAGSDEHFAFFSRPTKAELVKLGAEQAKHVEKMAADLDELIAEDEELTKWDEDRAALIDRMRELI